MSSLNINTDLVRGLIADQFPQWSGLPVREVVPNGWDNRTFRLGDDKSIRLPSAERYVAQVEKEHRWLPIIAAGLRLPIPIPLAMGKPSDDYPWLWSVYGWIEGEVATSDRIGDMPLFALSLGEFLRDLRGIGTSGAPIPGVGNFYRGGDLSVYDAETREAIGMLDGKFDLDAAVLSRVWGTALASSWHETGVWIHGDVSSGNLLVRDGELAAVIDWGGMAVGDPACDLAIAWTMFDAGSRAVFRDTLDLDDATWERGRGWTLWKALIILSGISETNAVEAERSLETAREILAD